MAYTQNGTTTTFNQSYSYDTGNRLQTANETGPGTGSAVGPAPTRTGQALAAVVEREGQQASLLRFRQQCSNAWKASTIRNLVA